MHATSAAREVQQQLREILDGAPKADVYDVVDAAPADGCCGGGRTEAAAAEPGVPAELAGEHSCCGAS